MWAPPPGPGNFEPRNNSYTCAALLWCSKPQAGIGLNHCLSHESNRDVQVQSDQEIVGSPGMETRFETSLSIGRCGAQTHDSQTQRPMWNPNRSKPRKDHLQKKHVKGAQLLACYFGCVFVCVWLLRTQVSSTSHGFNLRYMVTNAGKDLDGSN